MKTAQQHSLPKYCSPTPSSSRHKGRVSQRVFSQQMQFDLSLSHAGLILIAEEEQPQPSCLLAISASLWGLVQSRLLAKEWFLRARLYWGLPWLQLPLLVSEQLSFYPELRTTWQPHTFCSLLWACNTNLTKNFNCSFPKVFTLPWAKVLALRCNFLLWIQTLFLSSTTSLVFLLNTKQDVW